MSEEAALKKQAEETPENEKLTLNRREFLNLAWLASMGFLVFEIAGVSIAFGYPRFKEGEFGGIIPIGSTDALPAPGSPPENRPKVKLWITNTEEGLIALYKVCPHLGCLFGWNDQEFKFICPCHGSQFEHNGDWIKGPAPRNLDRFVVRVVDSRTGEVLAETPDDGGPVELPDNPNAVVEVDTGAKISGAIHD
ncbi:MAG: Rieske 2Fe-2S domain-containing protein [Chloroflexi bacterium]|nr:Rieske 2Fe-2S domain-containing protein [Chloroflexota bacterium]